ncbi:MAG: hypothetical protein M3O55_06760 [Actinomycetota bacterium]|nr:hypothetical protein [Actinomycetota bacterium]
MQNESATTVFLTTHYLEEAEQADRVCGIANGRVVATASPAELTSRLVGRQMRYAVDLVRPVYYVGSPERSRVVLDGFAVDAAVAAGLLAVFVVVGTALFVRNERNR